MKKIWPLLLFLLVCPAISITNAVGAANPGNPTNPADFAVTGIFIKQDNFIHVKLQNLSAFDVSIQPGLKEKIFLTIYIDNIKRAEYKLKYMDRKLFKKRSTIFFRTNFRAQKGRRLKIKVHVNPLKIIKETNFLNNTLGKILQGA
jgi:hypothetical protein